MRLYGLTGGIGTGKTTVAAILRELGATVVDADEGARAVVEPGTDGLRQVVEAFGDQVLDARGRLDRAQLAGIVFNDPEARGRLNAIVHPLVGAWVLERTAEAAARGDEVVIHDIPLLFENHRENMFEAVIVVYAPPETALRRLVGRGLAEADARARIGVQLPIDEKVERADYVVDNSGDLDATREQVERVWTELAKR